MIRCYLKGQLVAELKDSERDEAIKLIKTGQADKINTVFGEPKLPFTNTESIPKKKGFLEWCRSVFLTNEKEV